MNNTFYDLTEGINISMSPPIVAGLSSIGEIANEFRWREFRRWWRDGKTSNDMTVLEYNRLLDHCVSCAMRYMRLYSA